MSMKFKDMEALLEKLKSGIEVVVEKIEEEVKEVEQKVEKKIKKAKSEPAPAEVPVPQEPQA